ncbi:MAG: hypothetical protein V4623_09050 [Pseudomonadota bacterium]
MLSLLSSCSLKKIRRGFLLLLLPLLAACSDQRAAFQIDTSDHALTLIREQRFFWDKTANYTLVAARMPSCMRRHALPSAALDAQFEVYSPGNNAWILKQKEHLYVVETRNCDGFAKLESVPEDGLGALVGTFKNQDGSLAFVPAPRASAAASPDLVLPPDAGQTDVAAPTSAERAEGDSNSALIPNNSSSSSNSAPASSPSTPSTPSTPSSTQASTLSDRPESY